MIPSDKGQVCDEQLARYASLIYDQTGIKVSPQKKTLLSNRLRRRLRATGVESYDDYLALLRRLPVSDPEWDAFLQEITTHETYLFRDQGQWDWLRGEYLPRVQAEARAGRRSRSLRIWSAAASTGDEAATIACCLADRLTNPSEWKIEIVGTDIGVDAVRQAQQGAFSESAMRHTPESYRRRFFTQGSPPRPWVLRPHLAAWLTFRQHNLLSPMPGGFDLAFLKNVLIYFDADSKRRVMQNVTAALKPGAALITGPAEGVSDFLTGFERGQPWLHYKPVGAAVGPAPAQPAPARRP